MTPDSDDLEEALRQNLELRRELLTEVAKAKDSGARGFHWLGLLLAVSLLMIGLGVIASDPVQLFLAVGGPQATIMRSAIGLVGIIGACLALYGLVRAIGWLIGRP